MISRGGGNAASSLRLATGKRQQAKQRGAAFHICRRANRAMAATSGTAIHVARAPTRVLGSKSSDRTQASDASEAAHGRCAGQVQQAINVGGVQQQQHVQHRRRYDAALVGHQHPEQPHVVQQDEQQPDADGDPPGGAAVTHQHTH